MWNRGESPSNFTYFYPLTNSKTKNRMDEIVDYVKKM